MYLHGRQQDVFQNSLVREQLIALEHHADFLPHLRDGLIFPQNRLPIQQNLAALNGFQTVQAAKQGALAAAGGADDDYYLALMNIQVKILKNRVLTKGFAQMPHA